MPAGKPPKGGKVAIVKVEILDADGESHDPARYEFWVVIMGGPNPRVISGGHETYQDALDWLSNAGLVLGGPPPP